MKGPLFNSAITLIGMYIALKFVLPLFTAPLPASLIFLYLALTLSSLLGYAENGSWANMTSTLETIVVLWMPVYLYLSMRRVYGQGHFVTALKFLVIGTCYFVLALMGFILTVIAGLWLA